MDDLVVRWRSVCSLDDPLTQCWDRGQPVQIIPEPRPQGVPQCVSRADRNYALLLLISLFVSWLNSCQIRKTIVKWKLVQKNRIKSYTPMFQRQDILRKDPYCFSHLLTVGSFPVHVRAGACLRWERASQALTIPGRQRQTNQTVNHWPKGNAKFYPITSWIQFNCMVFSIKYKLICIYNVLFISFHYFNADGKIKERRGWRTIKTWSWEQFFHS